MGTYFVYVLWSATGGRYYVGSTGDLDNRVREHNAGESQSTRYGLPWTLVHFETFPSRAEAVRRERYLKTGKGREELRRLLAALG